MLTQSFLSVAEAAALIGVSEGRVRQLLLDGTLQGQKVGRLVWAISRDEAARYAALDPPTVGRPRGSEKKSPESENSG